MYVFLVQQLSTPLGAQPSAQPFCNWHAVLPMADSLHGDPCETTIENEYEDLLQQAFSADQIWPTADAAIDWMRRYIKMTTQISLLPHILQFAVHPVRQSSPGKFRACPGTVTWSDDEFPVITPDGTGSFAPIPPCKICSGPNDVDDYPFCAACASGAFAL